LAWRDFFEAIDKPLVRGLHADIFFGCQVNQGNCDKSQN